MVLHRNSNSLLLLLPRSHIQALVWRHPKNPSRPSSQSVLERQMGNGICYLASQGWSTSACLSTFPSISKPAYVNKSLTRAKNYLSAANTQAAQDRFSGLCNSMQRGNRHYLSLKSADSSGKSQICLEISSGCHNKNVKFMVPTQRMIQQFSGLCISKQRGNIHSLSIKSAVSSGKSQICLDISSGCHNKNVKFLLPKQRMIQQINCNMGRFTGSGGYTGLIFGLLICHSTSENVQAEAAQPKQSREDSSVMFSHKKKVWTDYSVIGIPGDGRCLFRSVAHGACLRSGKPAPNGSLQKELADELRVLVADEFVKRRKETEWFVEGDFDAYVSEIRKPHVWGGEPELFMASHVLQMPITVYMIDEKSGGLISIAEYGQEEYGKEDPIQVLYHGYGHYDALLIPGNKGTPKSRL